ncbi:MAG: putative integral membrane protein [Algoriphagus marincola HL-49]|uniref:Putative integral membrane protein n=1 Tax=Algoriphagus marincola HL-49 TaxID=1305737 RepID=A0A0N8KH33_9BACT|nr:MAG: putative integral membrane protein [Algoriphagus marincola HL-49]
MTFQDQPLFIAATLCVAVFFGIWLTRFPWGRTVGTPIWVILICAFFANVGLIPSAMEGHPIYDGVFVYLAPLGIFIALLEVDLRSLKDAGIPILLMFGIGTVGTVVGVAVSWVLVRPEAAIGELAGAVAGMYTGTYIGGSINFNAVALSYAVNENGPLFAATTVVDNLIGTPWIIATLILPRYLQKLFPRKKLQSAQSTPKSAGVEVISMSSLASMLALGFLAMVISGIVAEYFPQVPEIITLTTIALILAQFPAVKQLHGKQTLGFFMIMIFLGVIGTLCDISALSGVGELAGTLILFVGLLVLIHGLFVFGIGALLKMDWDVIAVASQANVGGNTTAIAAAESLNRPDLLIPGVLVGSLGNALGTYIGFLVAGAF